jgi:hypothetical protein
LTGDGVLGVTGVAHARPPRPEGLAKEVGHATAGESGLAVGGPDPIGDCRVQVESLVIVGLDVGLEVAGLRSRATDAEQRQIFVGGYRFQTAVTANDGV